MTFLIAYVAISIAVGAVMSGAAFSGDPYPRVGEMLLATALFAVLWPLALILAPLLALGRTIGRRMP